MGNHMSCISLAAAAAAAEFQQQQNRRINSSSLFHEDLLQKEKKMIMVWALQQPPPGRRNSSAADDEEIGAPDVSMVASVDEIEGPVSAGDVMVDHPGHFLCCVSRQTLGLLHLDGGTTSSQRTPPPAVTAVPADQDLTPSAAFLDHVYLLLPMARLRSRFSPPEIHHLRRAFQSPPLRRFHHDGTAGGIQSVPPSTVPPSQPSTTHRFASPSTSNALAPDPASDPAHHRMQLYLRSRSWVPRLETITEIVPPEYTHHHQKRIQQYSTTSSFSHHMLQQRRRLWAHQSPTAAAAAPVVGTVG